VVLGFVFAFLLVVPEARADRATELKAREAFASGRYDDALNLFAKLYAETLHPVYLRNIGRCYQNLGDPDKAISSFHEYLRKAKNLPDDERAEIDGYIGEMEDLERKRAREAEAPARPPPPIAQTLPERPMVSQRPPPPPDEPAPVYKRWWFWTLIGGAVAAGAVGFALARGKTDLCSPGRNCGP
jgi:tetratricopeptide repeat protein